MAKNVFARYQIQCLKELNLEYIYIYLSLQTQ